MIYLIQGFFFSESLYPGIGYDESGAKVFLQEVTLRSMFSGVIGPQEQNNPADLIGRMTDHYGNSILTCIQIENDSLFFTKLYEHRKDSIQYQFKKCADGTWEGIYRGKASGSGRARCILTPVSESFLLPIPTQTRPIRKGGPRGDPLERYKK